MEFGPSLPGEQDDHNEPEIPSTLMHTLHGHEGPVLAIRFNVQGSYCLSCGKDRTARLWNPYRGLLIKTYTGHGYELRDACIARDNCTFSTCGGDRQLFLWDVTSGNIIRKFRGHESLINSVCFAAEDEVLVTGGYDRTVNLWDCKSRSVSAIQTLTGFKDSVTCVRSSSHEIFASSVDGMLKRFDIRMTKAYIDQFKESITCFALSKNGASVLCSCMADGVVLVDKIDGQVLATYYGHKHQNLKIECGFGKSDQHVFSGSEDGFVLFWDLMDATIVKRFQVHEDTVCSCVVHPENNTLLTSSTDGTIKFWQ